MSTIEIEHCRGRSPVSGGTRLHWYDRAKERRGAVLRFAGLFCRRSTRVLAYRQCLAAVLGLFFLGACDSQRSGSSVTIEPSGMSLSAPRFLTRAVEPDALFAEVTVEYVIDSETVSSLTTAARSKGSEVWRVALDIPADTEFTLDVTWFDTEDAPLRADLATVSKTFNSGSSGNRIALTIDLSDFDFSGFNADDDGFTNLEERENGTSPFVANQPQEDDVVVGSGNPVVVQGPHRRVAMERGAAE